MGFDGFVPLARGVAPKRGSPDMSHCHPGHDHAVGIILACTILIVQASMMLLCTPMALFIQTLVPKQKVPRASGDGSMDYDATRDEKERRGKSLVKHDSRSRVFLLLEIKVQGNNGFCGGL